MSRIIITVKNEVGVVADISKALADRNINIEGINAQTTEDTGIITLETDDPDNSLVALADAGFKAVIDDFLVFRLRDEPGALAKVAGRFKDAGINIQSMHIINRYGGYATIALSADDRQTAAEIVGSQAVV